MDDTSLSRLEKQLIELLDRENLYFEGGVLHLPGCQLKFERHESGHIFVRWGHSIFDDQVRFASSDLWMALERAYERERKRKASAMLEQLESLLAAENPAP